MNRSAGAIATALVALGVAFAPTASYATSDNGKDPGAFAALGSVYLASIFKDAGIGSGHSGGSSAKGGGSPGWSGHGGGTSGSFAPGSFTQGPGGGSSSGPGIGQTTSSPGGGGPGLPTFQDHSSGDDGTGTHGGNSDVPPKDILANFDPKLPDFVDTTSPDEILTGNNPIQQNQPLPQLTSARIVQVPEPASLALFGIGLAGLGLFHRLRSKA